MPTGCHANRSGGFVEKVVLLFRRLVSIKAGTLFLNRTEDWKILEGKKMATENLSQMARSLGDEISKVRGDCADVSMKIEEHLKSKTDARAKYDSCLDKGDGPAMADCLRIIKAANKEIEVLKLQYEIFNEKLPALHERHKKMRVVEQRNLKVAAESLKAARELKKRCDDEVNLCVGVLGELNELKNLIDKESRSF